MLHFQDKKDWVNSEAKKRGLPNLRQSVEAFEIYTRKDIVDLFEKYNVLSKKEILSRQNIRAEKYSTITQIEARALLDIIDSIVLPNSYQQQEQLAKSITAVKSVGGSLKNQNLTPHEIKTIITRVGENSKIVLTGDPYQIDNPFVDTYSNGLSYVMEENETILL